MALSGVFAVKNICNWSLNENIVFMLKKALRILLPFFTIAIFTVFWIALDTDCQAFGFCQHCFIVWLLK